MFSTSDLKHLHWTPYQQFARHAASGCDKETADLIGIGTMSGSGRNEKGENARVRLSLPPMKLKE